MKTEFDKSEEAFPSKREDCFVSYCSVSPLARICLEAAHEFETMHAERGVRAFEKYPGFLGGFHRAFGELLKTSHENISMTCNTAQGLNFISNGYPFEPGDQIVSYIHEYPANHYPWLLQARSRGVELIELPDRDPVGGLQPELPRGWLLEDLERVAGERTRIVALSHVQFTSGFRADLAELSSFCAPRGIDIVLDVAQSLGVHPVYPEEHGIAAVAGCGWKWLMGPVGSGVLYTSPEFRAKLRDTMSGADHMKQGTDYLDHTWNPFQDGRRFEYSTLPFSYAVGLSKSVRNIFLRYGVEAIEQEVFRLQDRVLEVIDRERYRPVTFGEKNRSGILSFVTKEDPKKIVNEMYKKNITLTARGGYLRIAPHFCTKDEEVDRVVEALHKL